MLEDGGGNGTCSHLFHVPRNMLQEPGGHRSPHRMCAHVLVLPFFSFFTNLLGLGNIAFPPNRFCLIRSGEFPRSTAQAPVQMGVGRRICIPDTFSTNRQGVEKEKTSCHCSSFSYYSTRSRFLKNSTRSRRLT